LRAVARILIVGGGCRGRRLSETLVGEGHAVRITTRSDTRRAAIEDAGAECWIGTPDRLATLRGALDGVTILCWLMGCASGPEPELQALHTTRLQFFLTQAIDTTVRGLLYEASGDGLAGERIARELTARNAIPAAFLTAPAASPRAWLQQAHAAIGALLRGG
jgi:uncharacterized protein YbjT (DUF2867 family)